MQINKENLDKMAMILIGIAANHAYDANGIVDEDGISDFLDQSSCELAFKIRERAVDLNKILNRD